eukprot:gene8006-8654_t
MRKNTKWCKDKIRMHGVKIGRSWGTLPRGDQQQWDSRKCNEILNLGTVQSCDERYGWKWFEKWLKNKKNVFESGSTVKCIQDYKTTSYCKMENVVLNFNQIQTHGGARGYSNGFLNFYGKQYEENKSFLPVYPGISSISDRRVPSPATQDCSKKETRPTFILSNDDIFNLGHYMNDVMGIWSMSVLANRAMNESLLINFDGYRYGGPAGGGAHRLMLNGKPDEHGPYSVEYYHKWFNNQVDQAKNYKGKVCFQELYIFPLPGVPWFWNEWGRDDECSMQAASPLYQSFNVYLRQLPIKVTAQDFSKLTFAEQIHLSHTASVLVSMHGAGTTHIFHMAVGDPKCCALMELFPDTSLDLYTMKGYGNLARMLGKKYGLVLGSTSPWAEAALLNGKAKHITTIDVSGTLQFEGKDSQFQLLSMNKTSQLYLDRQWDPVDFAFSYSFLEHLGFGIIDHTIDPYADLEMLAKIRCLLKPGGLLFLGVPQAPDGIVWNQYRLYGKYRLFLLLLGWKLIDLHPDHCNINQPEKRGNVKCQPVLVLEKPGGAVNHRHHLGNNGGGGAGIGHHPHKAHHPIIHQQTI